MSGVRKVDTDGLRWVMEHNPLDAAGAARAARARLMLGHRAMVLAHILACDGSSFSFYGQMQLVWDRERVKRLRARDKRLPEM